MIVAVFIGLPLVVALGARVLPQEIANEFAAVKPVDELFFAYILVAMKNATFPHGPTEVEAYLSREGRKKAWLGERCGTSRNATVSDWLAGKYRPNPEARIVLSVLTGADLTADESWPTESPTTHPERQREGTGAFSLPVGLRA